jgi:hypothetical protein
MTKTPAEADVLERLYFGLCLDIFLVAAVGFVWNGELNQAERKHWADDALVKYSSDFIPPNATKSFSFSVGKFTSAQSTAPTSAAEVDDT